MSSWDKKTCARKSYAWVPERLSLASAQQKNTETQVLHFAGMATVLLWIGSWLERAVQQLTHPHTIYCHGDHDTFCWASRRWPSKERLVTDKCPEISTGWFYTSGMVFSTPLINNFPDFKAQSSGILIGTKLPLSWRDNLSLIHA